MMRAFPWVYLIAAFAFIYLPVGALVLFSFQDGNLPVPPFNGPSIKWYADILADDDLTSALGNSLLVAFGSSAVAVTVGFLAAYGLARHVLPGSAVVFADRAGETIPQEAPFDLVFGRLVPYDHDVCGLGDASQ